MDMQKLTEARLYAEHQEIEKMSFSSFNYEEKLQILSQARQRQRFIEMSTYNRLTAAKEEVNAIWAILRPWISYN